MFGIYNIMYKKNNKPLTPSRCREYRFYRALDIRETMYSTGLAPAARCYYIHNNILIQ